MNETLHNISKWLAHNKLFLNTEKTVYIEFGNQVDSILKNLHISMQGTIRRVKRTKYLGIIFDSHMRWNEHIEYIYNKTKYLIFIFYKLSKIMTADTLWYIERFEIHDYFNTFLHSLNLACVAPYYGLQAWLKMIYPVPFMCFAGSANSSNKLLKKKKKLHKIALFCRFTHIHFIRGTTITEGNRKYNRSNYTPIESVFSKNDKMTENNSD